MIKTYCVSVTKTQSSSFFCGVVASIRRCYTDVKSSGLGIGTVKRQIPHDYIWTLQCGQNIYGRFSLRTVNILTKT